MIRINKHFLSFLSVGVSLAIVSSMGLQKLLPVVLHPTVYYCQSFLRSFSTKLPPHMGSLVLCALILFMLFIIGKVLLLSKKIHTLRKNLISHTISTQQLHTLLTKLNIDEYTLIVESTKPFAFCFGIRHPKIYVSTALLSLLDEHELEAVLLHEAYHLHNKDTLTMFIASVSQSLFFFFPLLSDLLYNYRIEREVRADQHAIASSGSATSLVAALKKLITTPTVPAFAYAAIADEDTLEARIKALTHNNFRFKKFHRLHTTVSIVSLLIIFAVMIAPVQAVDIQNHTQHATMICLEGHDCAMWCKQHGTVQPYTPVQPMSSKPYSSL